MSTNLTAAINGTQRLSCLSNTAKKIRISVIYCSIFVVSLIGNIIIGIIVTRTKSMRKTINFFILNLAMSDLLLSIFQFPVVVSFINIGTGQTSDLLGQSLCKAKSFLVNVSRHVSVQSLVLIAVGRFGAVVFPLRSQLINCKYCKFFILATWIIAMAVHIPELLALKIDGYKGLVCEGKWNEPIDHEVSSSFRNYLVPILVLFFHIPLVLIAIIYLIVFSKLKSQNIPGEGSAKIRAQRLSRERNLLKMSIAIVLTFVVCWLPATIWWLLFFYPPDSTMASSCGFRYFAAISSSLARLNCAINPCICFIFCGNYRQGLKNLMRYCPACTRVNPGTA